MIPANEPLIYQSLSSTQQTQQLGELICQSFGAPPAEWPAYCQHVGRDNLRIIRRADQILAGMGVCPMGQWYGGECLSIACLTAVCVAPEQRGSGVGITLMRETLQNLHQAEFSLSVLYPATQVFYRKVGYGQGGSLCSWEAPTHQINLCDRQLPMQAVAPQNTELLEPIYRQKAQKNCGNLERHAIIWHEITKVSPEQTIYAYLIGPKSAPEGYVIFTQIREKDKLIMEIRDWAVLTEVAARRLWTFCSDHRTMVQTVRWRGAPVDPFLRLWPEQTATLKHKEHWMVRIIDVVAALSQRGYPQGITAELDFEIQDEELPQNEGNYHLQVSGGKGQVSPGGKGELKLKIQTLASLFTGFYTPLQLQLATELEGSPAALAIATLLFTGPEPWLADFF